MEQITLGQLLEAVKGRLLGGFNDLTAPISGVQRDSRLVTPGDLFLPLVGERADGHSFIEKALEGGASGCLTSRELSEYRGDKFYVLVEDTRLALGDLARWYRGRFDIPVIGITGSTGKTTTKDMVAAILSEKFNVLKTQGNFNNDIGLPETILSITGEHELAVIEMGMNHFGEIDYLTHIARPDFGIIINVGEAHIENLGSREGILQAKAELFHGMTGEGLAVLNGDDDMLPRLEGKLELPILWCGEGERCQCRCLSITEEGEDGMVMTADLLGEEMTFHIPCPGRHMMYSVLMGAVIGRKLGLTAEEIARGVSHFVPSGKRMRRLSRKKGITLIDDTYNANPQAVKAVLDILSKRPEPRKIAVLGDMFELGEQSDALHFSCGQRARELGIDCLYAVGGLSKATARGAEGGNTAVHWFPTKEEALTALAEELTSNCVVLFKASHSMHFDWMVEAACGLTEPV